MCILVIIVLNAVLGFVKEHRAEESVAALQRMAAETATVVRVGQEARIPAVDVVPGNILVLGEGDAVSADARLVEAASLKLAEASLTGESEAVLKDVDPLTEPAAPGDRVNMVFNGTAVTSGRGRAVVPATTVTEHRRIRTLICLNSSRHNGRAKAHGTPGRWRSGRSDPRRRRCAPRTCPVRYDPDPVDTRRREHYYGLRLVAYRRAWD